MGSCCQLFDLTLPPYITGFQVAEAKKRVSILESYLEQRGVALPEGYVSCQVILANPKYWYALLLNDVFIQQKMDGH